VKGYGLNEWRDDMRKIMTNCGVEFNDTIFVFSDTQIVNETFVEDVNNILNNGEIPNLFNAVEDY
jgi:dynein heavy chain